MTRGRWWTINQGTAVLYQAAVGQTVSVTGPISYNGPEQTFTIVIITKTVVRPKDQAHVYSCTGVITQNGTNLKWKAIQ